jgi:hypothetical protein
MTNGNHENTLVEGNISNLQKASLTESLKVGNKQEEEVQKN